MRRFLLVALAAALFAVSESPAGVPPEPAAPAPLRQAQGPEETRGAAAPQAEGMKAVKRQDVVLLAAGAGQYVGTIIARGDRAILLFSEADQRIVEIEASRIRSIEEGVAQGFIDLPAGASEGVPAAAQASPAAPAAPAKSWKEQRAEIEKARIELTKKSEEEAKKKADEAKKKADAEKKKLDDSKQKVIDEKKKTADEKKAAEEKKKKADEARKRNRGTRQRQIRDQLDSERERIIREWMDKAQQKAGERINNWESERGKVRGENPLLPDVEIPEGGY